MRQLLSKITSRFNFKSNHPATLSSLQPSTFISGTPKEPNEMSGVGKLVMIDIASAGFNPEYSDNCSEIFAGVFEIRKHLERFDYDESKKANGYRSLLKIISIYSDIAFKDMSDNSFSSVSQPVQDIGKIFALMMRHVLINQVLDKSSLVWPVSYDFIRLGLSMESLVYSFYGKHHNFWLCPSLRTILGHYITLTSYRSSSTTSLIRDIKCANTPKIFANFAMNASAEFAANLWNLSESFFYRKLISFLIYGTKSSKGQTSHAARQDMIKISGSGELIYNPSGTFTVDLGQVRLRILKEQKGVPDSECAVFHIHGAGFIAQSPDSHEVLQSFKFSYKSVLIFSAL